VISPWYARSHGSRTQPCRGSRPAIRQMRVSHRRSPMGRMRSPAAAVSRAGPGVHLVAKVIAPRFRVRRSKRSWPPTRHRRGHPVGCVIVRPSRRSGVTTTSVCLLARSTRSQNKSAPKTPWQRCSHRSRSLLALTTAAGLGHRQSPRPRRQAPPRGRSARIPLAISCVGRRTPPPDSRRSR
jgi:hypothetical protein